MSRDISPSRPRKVLRLLLALASLVAFAFIALHLWARHRLESEVRAVAERGETLSFEALQPSLPDDDRNGSNVLDALVALLRLAPEDVTPAEEMKSLRLDMEPDAATLARVQKLLAVPEHRLALELLDRSAAIEQARYLRGDGDAPGLPAHVQDYLGNRVKVLRLTLLLRGRALLALHDGRLDGACRDIAHHLRLASWLEDEIPLASSRLLSLAAADRGLELLEQLERHPPSAAARAVLATALSRLEAWSPTRAFDGERAYVYQASARASQFLLFFGPHDAGPWQRFSRQFLSRWFDLAQTANFLDSFDQFLHHVRTPTHGRSPWQSPQSTSPFQVGAELLIPNFLEAVHRMDELEARLRMARIALAWAAWIEAEGSTPPSPTDLVPHLLRELPQDPFSDGPFLFERDSGGRLLRSVGRDREEGGDEEDDLVWRLPEGAATL